MDKINRQQLEELLSSDNINGNTFISIETLTTPKLKGGKKNPQQGCILKKNIANVMVFQNKKSNGYDNMVRRRLEKEGKDPNTFELKPRVWGERIENTPLIHHKGRKYLEVIFIHNILTEYYYYNDDINGQPEQIDKDNIQGLDQKKPTQAGLEDTVIIRTYKLENIKRIKINKKEYLVVD